MKRLILVDCENVLCDELIEGLLKVKDCEIVLVLGVKQKKCLNALSKKSNVSIIRAKSAGKNACDFVLVAEMTKRLIKSSYTKTVIVSNDHGFDAAILHIKDMGFSVIRHDLQQFVKEVIAPPISLPPSKACKKIEITQKDLNRLTNVYNYYNASTTKNMKLNSFRNKLSLVVGKNGVENMWVLLDYLGMLNKSRKHHIDFFSVDLPKLKQYIQDNHT